MKNLIMTFLFFSIFFSISAQTKIYNANPDETKGDQLGVIIGDEIFVTDKNGVKGEKVGEYKDDGKLYSYYNSTYSLSDILIGFTDVMYTYTAETFEISKEGVIKSSDDYKIVGFSDNIDLIGVGALLLLQIHFGLRD